MRLICSNCDAQYEVPDSVMPPEGREVQCSNCSHTWFQEHPDSDTAQAVLSRREADGALRDDPPLEQEEQPDAQPTTVEYSEEKTAMTDGDATAAAPEDTSPAKAPPDVESGEFSSPPRRKLDPAVADVLRTEAELEAKMRSAQNSAFETQPELGLPPRAAVERSQRLKEARDARSAADEGTNVRSDTNEMRKAAPATPTESRRELLPDIEEINSTLRSNNDRTPDTDAGQTAQVEYREKRSSRRGFMAAISAIALLAVVYNFAPELSRSVPQAEPSLTAYTALVDGARAWLDAQIAQLLNWLDEAAVSSAK